jgi:hypothetical protein
MSSSFPSYFPPNHLESVVLNDGQFHSEHHRKTILFNDRRQPSCSDIPAAVPIEPSDAGGIQNYYSSNNRTGEDTFANSVMMCEGLDEGYNKEQRRRRWRCYFFTGLVLLICVTVTVVIGVSGKGHRQQYHPTSSPKTSLTHKKQPPLNDPREQLLRPISPPTLPTADYPTVDASSSLPVIVGFDDHPLPMLNHGESELYKYLVSLVGPDVLDGATADSNSESPTYAAYRWLAQDESVGVYPLQTVKQRFVLACLFYSTNSGGGLPYRKDTTSWKNNKGWMTYSNECHWYGVQCRGGHIISLNLTNNGLEGIVPEELSLFSDSLLELDLSENYIVNAYDELAFLKDLKKLKLLYMHDTFVTSQGLPLYISTLTSLGE